MSFEHAPPDPTDPDLIIGIFEYLKEQGITRDPENASLQKTLPPLWMEPRDGCPAPGPVEGFTAAEISPNPEEGGPGLVVSVEKSTGVPSPAYEGFLRMQHVQFVIRSYIAQTAYAFEQKLRVALNDKRGWMMYNVPVNESLLYRDLQPITRDKIAYTYSLEYQFNLWGAFTPV